MTHPNYTPPNSAENTVVRNCHVDVQSVSSQTEMHPCLSLTDTHLSPDKASLAGTGERLQ